MKLSDSDPDSAWDRVRKLKRGTGDLPRWFVRGRRELDGARRRRRQFWSPGTRRRAWLGPLGYVTSEAI